MDDKSLQWCCEEFFLQLLKTNPTLTGVKFVHQNASVDSKTDQIIADSKVGAQDLGGCRPFNVTVTLAFNAVKSDETQTDLIIKSMREYIDAPPPEIVNTIPVVSNFLFLEMLNENVNSDRKVEGKARKNYIAISLLAALR